MPPWLLLTACLWVLPADTSREPLGTLSLHPSEEVLYHWSVKGLTSTRTKRPHFSFDGKKIVNLLSGRQLYRWRKDTLIAIGDGTKLYQWRAPHVIRVRDRRVVYTFDGRFWTNYVSGTKKFSVRGEVPLALALAVVVGLL